MSQSSNRGTGVTTRLLIAAIHEQYAAASTFVYVSSWRGGAEEAMHRYERTMHALGIKPVRLSSVCLSYGHKAKGEVCYAYFMDESQWMVNGASILASVRPAFYVWDTERAQQIVTGDVDVVCQNL